MQDTLFAMKPETTPPQISSAVAAVSSASAPVTDAPLAARLRPRTFEEYAGQEHLLAPGKLLRRAIDSDRFSSIILFGPPGTGKTTLAEIIARNSQSKFVRLSGVLSTVADIRREVQAANTRRLNGKRTILFIDEIHRFNKAQQDSLLPDVENGTVRLIGATTENPQFSVIGALISRSLVFQLQPLSVENIRALLLRALSDARAFPDKKIEMAPEALDFLSGICEGDARRALGALEIAVLTTGPGEDGIIHIPLETAEASVQRKMIAYGDDGHYDTASAFIKSMRGSDPDAAVYYLAKMLHAEEDIRFIARRIVIFASEDVGNADPRALEIAVSAMQAVQMIGMPEARIILSQAVTYCATAPKSNASIKAVDQALKTVRENRLEEIPAALRDAHYAGAKAMGHGVGYLYPHDFGGFVAQEYLPGSHHFYEPADIGYESRIRERMAYWKSLREQSTGKTPEAGSGVQHG